MDKQELMDYLDPAIKLAEHSDDQAVRNAAVILLILQGSVLAGDEVLQSLTDVVYSFSVRVAPMLQDRTREPPA